MSFQRFVMLREGKGGGFDAVSDRALEMKRAVRDPQNKEYIHDQSVRELVAYCLEEVDRFATREVARQSDPDEALLMIRQFREGVFKELAKIAGKHPMDAEKIGDMLDGLFDMAIKAVT